ncbi:hypothetical protein [Actinoplanes subglobosus]|uniref:Flavin reductase n=1 Tax=Actinoplanes subglobosus TaxID=1547892 RepID=A0ABV8IL34_9ACTN
MVMLTPRTEHQPNRPSWNCRKCEEAWPCAPGKVELAEQYMNRNILFLYLASAAIEMLEDVYGERTTGVLPGVIRKRVIAWADALRSTPEPSLQAGGRAAA